MKVRPAASFLPLDEAMRAVAEIGDDRVALMAYLVINYPEMHPADATVTVRPHGYDNRIGWDTHMVCVDGRAVLFTDGPVRGFSS